MKKIIAAAALALAGLTLAAPTHAVAPDTAQAAHARAASAQSIATGLFLISNLADDTPGSALSIGPVPPVYPPLDVPVRYLSGPLTNHWLVQRGDDGLYTISAGRGGPADYRLVERDGAVFASATQEPSRWMIQGTEDGGLTLGTPDGRLATLHADDVPQVTLDAPDGSPAQAWRLMQLSGD
ncbi:hypothetical protein [Streptomyces sp. NPDC091040]|uniref:hypothetical protein n=1 Tax=Streptomyces sp. NPDC091040 TaxID=3365972 RepID=UPI0037F5A38B